MSHNLSIQKILIFNPFGIGDVLFSTPLVRNVRLNFPSAAIWYIGNRRTQPILDHNIFIDNVVVFEKDEWRTLCQQSKIKFLWEMFRFFRTIRSQKFDVVFDLSFNAQYGFFLKLCSIPMRIGYNFKKRGKFLTHSFDLPQGFTDFHVAQHYLNLLSFIGIDNPRPSPFDLFITHDDRQHAQKILESNNIIDTKMKVVVSPGAGDSWQDSASYRRWPQENFVALCQKIADNHGAHIILTGSSAEAPLCQQIEQHLTAPTTNLCGKISLIDFCALLQYSNLFITNDGGPLHIAQALTIPTIGFIGPVDERVYGVFLQNPNIHIFINHDIDCRPCYKRFRLTPCAHNKQCLRDISVEDVYIKAEQMLKSNCLKN